MNNESLCSERLLRVTIAFNLISDLIAMQCFSIHLVPLLLRDLRHLLLKLAHTFKLQVDHIIQRRHAIYELLYLDMILSFDGVCIAILLDRALLERVNDV